jgi:hypothetical protein
VALANGRRMLTEEANPFAANVLPIIDSLRRSGVIDLRGLASALNGRGIRTARGGRWHVSNVRNLLLRADGFDKREYPGARWNAGHLPDPSDRLG